MFIETAYISYFKPCDEIFVNITDILLIINMPKLILM